MLKRIVVGAVAAGAISVPLAGVAMADEGTTTNTTNDSQAGVGRVFDLPDGYQTPGDLFRHLRDEGRQAGFRSLPQYLRSGQSEFGQVQSPGQLLRQFRIDMPGGNNPGDDNGSVGDDNGGVADDNGTQGINAHVGVNANHGANAH